MRSSPSETSSGIVPAAIQLAMRAPIAMKMKMAGSAVASASMMPFSISFQE